MVNSKNGRTTPLKKGKNKSGAWTRTARPAE